MLCTLTSILTMGERKSAFLKQVWITLVTLRRKERKMKQTRFHNQFFTIPNILSYCRFLLIPVFLWLYCVKQSYIAAALVMAISGATDVVDGWIARHFNLVTDWGKIIDPFADKLTQIAIAFCLAWRYPAVWILLGILIGKEFYMGLIGLIFIKKTDHVEGSVWYGKATTVAFFFVSLILLGLPNLPIGAVVALVLAECGLLILSMILYTLRYLRLFKQYQKQEIK